MAWLLYIVFACFRWLNHRIGKRKLLVENLFPFGWVESLCALSFIVHSSKFWCTDSKFFYVLLLHRCLKSTNKKSYIFLMLCILTHLMIFIAFFWGSCIHKSQQRRWPDRALSSRSSRPLMASPLWRRRPTPWRRRHHTAVGGTLWIDTSSTDSHVKNNGIQWVCIHDVYLQETQNRSIQDWQLIVLMEHLSNKQSSDSKFDQPFWIFWLDMEEATNILLDDVLKHWEWTEYT